MKKFSFTLLSDTFIISLKYINVKLKGTINTTIVPGDDATVLPLVA